MNFHGIFQVNRCVNFEDISVKVSMTNVIPYLTDLRNEHLKTLKHVFILFLLWSFYVNFEVNSWIFFLNSKMSYMI